MKNWELTPKENTGDRIGNSPDLRASMPHHQKSMKVAYATEEELKNFGKTTDIDKVVEILEEERPKSNQDSAWEERFEELWDYNGCSECSGIKVDMDKVKQFVRGLLSQRNKELAERVTHLWEHQVPNCPEALVSKSDVLSILEGE